MMIFEIINFLIRIGIVVYIVKQYILNRILSAIEQEKQAIKQLQERKKSIERACQQVQDHSVKEQQRFEDLEQKFKLWSHAMAVVQVEQEAWCQMQQKKIMHHIEKKAEFLQQQQIIKQEIPQILQSATVALQKKFNQDAALAKTYQADLLEALQK